MVKAILNLVGLLAIAGAVVFVGLQQTAIRKREADNTARYQCALSSRYETEDASGATVSYPVQNMYENCLKESGL